MSAAMPVTALGCATGQGYHFARPMPAADLTDLLTREAAALQGR